MTARRFPPPWTAEEYRGISYIVRDANNFAVAYVYFETEPGRRAAANRMTKDEARKIAAGIAKLPAEFHVMKFGATPARVVAVVRAANEQAALAEAIARRRFPPHLQKRLIVLRAS